LTISHVKWLVKFRSSVEGTTFLPLYIWAIFIPDQGGAWKFVKWQFQPVASVCATVELTFHSSKGFVG